MGEKIENYIENLIKDVEEFRKTENDLKEKITIEFMALNAIANAYKALNENRHN